VAFDVGVGAAARRVEVDTHGINELSRAIFRRIRQSLPRAAPARLCPELACLRGLLPPRILAAAEHRAQTIGLGADRVLITADAITEEAYLHALAAYLDTSYEALDTVARADCPLDDHDLIQAAAAGLLPLRRRDTLIWIIAPRCLTARNLADPRRPKPQLLRSFRLTSDERLRRFVTRHTHKELGRRAADGLRTARPLLSNAPRAHGAWRIAAITSAMLAVAVLPVISAATMAALDTILGAVLLAAAALRLATIAFPRNEPRGTIQRRDQQLPIYTLICALYHEAAVATDLVAAIRAIDYPPEKLDVKLILEPGDDETRRVLARLDLGPPFEIITAPPVGPRTKPKALNVGLAFARGEFTAVYDAEDVPVPDQLRRALDVFLAADDKLACVQAALTIDNTTDNWLTRMFTADYAGQFDVFLHGLAAMRLPLPLGGSSNHFRTAALRHVGGWDPYNVTEDADLGMRLCRLGYRADVVASATYEEAPARLVPWLKQRTRWYKGWMQTWLVHMRRPRALVRDLGVAGTLAFQLLFAGNVLSALVHPIFMAWLCYAFATTDAIRGGLAPLFTAALLSGYASTILPNAVGLKRRGLLGHAWVLIWAPIYWLLLSVAAWRALLQLLYAPQRWEKTEHGLARTSRLTDFSAAL
jgi:cellulose synthase/poly-beta-1,6-N-acetylglucosamine synthase-like glycosyltransferase